MAAWEESLPEEVTENPDGIWSAKALVDAPEMVAEVHQWTHKEVVVELLPLTVTRRFPSYLDKGDLEDHLRS